VGTTDECRGAKFPTPYLAEARPERDVEQRRRQHGLPCSTSSVPE